MESINLALNWDNVRDIMYKTKLQCLFAINFGTVALHAKTATKVFEFSWDYSTLCV